MQIGQAATVLVVTMYSSMNIAKVQQRLGDEWMDIPCSCSSRLLIEEYPILIQMYLPTPYLYRYYMKYASNKIDTYISETFAKFATYVPTQVYPFEYLCIRF